MLHQAALNVPFGDIVWYGIYFIILRGMNTNNVDNTFIYFPISFWTNQSVNQVHLSKCMFIDTRMRAALYNIINVIGV